MINFIIQKLKDRNIFITGGAGVGKSYVIKELIEDYRARGKLVIVLGSTGISAVEIGGVTVHSFFRFGICKNHEELKGFDRKQSSKLSELRKILALADLIVIDEISMIGAELFEMIYLRILSSKFNGRLLVTGDFYQLPPVRKEGESVPRASLFSDSDYAFGSYAWRQCEFFYVEMIGSKRTADAALYRLLCELRLGTPSEQTAELMRSLLIDAARVEPNATIISGRNAEVDAINNARLAKLNAPQSSFEGIYEALQSGVSEQKIQKWIASLNAPQSLTLKEGAKVLFTANKSGEFFNGEQGVVEKIEKSSGGEIESVVVKKPSGILSIRTKRDRRKRHGCRADRAGAVLSVPAQARIRNHDPQIPRHEHPAAHLRHRQDLCQGAALRGAFASDEPCGAWRDIYARRAIATVFAAQRKRRRGGSEILSRE